MGCTRLVPDGAAPLSEHPVYDLQHLLGSSHHSLLIGLPRGQPVVEVAEIRVVPYLDVHRLSQRPSHPFGALSDYAAVPGAASAPPLRRHEAGVVQELLRVWETADVSYLGGEK